MRSQPFQYPIINGMFGLRGSSDPMYNSYIFNNGYAQNVVVTVANLIPGIYDFYAYSPDAGFTLSIGTNSIGAKSCFDSPLSNPPAWQEGRQYVCFSNLTVMPGDTLTLTAGGLGKISGLQLAGIARD